MMCPNYQYYKNEKQCLIIRCPACGDEKWMHSWLYRVPNINQKIIKVRGGKSQDKIGLMNEFGAALQFFDGFGENWHALKDCLQNLYENEKFDLYTLVITDAEKLLIHEPDQFVWFMKTIMEVDDYYRIKIDDGDIFDRDSVVFKVVMETNQVSYLEQRIPHEYNQRIMK